MNQVRGNAQILGIKSEFRQAIINLGKNGIEAMPNGGSLTFACQQMGRIVQLQIIDNGLGMNMEQVARLGTPYFSAKEKGTGLGTMVSFTIIKKMSGKIDITSQPGKGTTYTITFPIHS